ncbi:MAG: hypothetical protein ACPHIC_07595 [Acidimicrobiales bacterium]
MNETLGIYLDADGISAAVATADASQLPRVLSLGTSRAATASAVAADPDGKVLVGDAALSAQGPIVTDPLERAVSGRTGALAAVITDLVDRSRVGTTAGRSPDRLAIVIPDDLGAVGRDRVVAAANSAGITDVSLVPYGLAFSRSGSADGSALASGAARIGALDAPAPLVTAEELGRPIETLAATPNPAPVADGPVSVFDEPDPPPVRSAPAPVASQPPRPRPVSPAPAPSTLVGAPPLQAVPRRTFAAPAIGIGVACILMLLLAVVVVSGGDDDETVTPPTTTSDISVTTVAPTTSGLESTTNSSTSTPPSTSTTVAPTSSSSSTTSSSTTTTTTPVRVAVPGPVTLVETGLQFDTGTVVRFGDSERDVISAAEAVLGPADSDSGRSSSDFCDGTVVRFVRWGNLELVFTGDPGPIGEEESGAGQDGGANVEPLGFSQWYADGHRAPTGLVTPEGVGESATVGLLEVTYGNALVLVPAFEDDIVGIFAVTNLGTGAVLNGTTLGLDPDGVVTSLWAGDSCQRIFT